MIGIRAHDLVTGNIKDVLTQAEDYGFDAIQLVFKKALKQDFSEENALIVKEELKHHNIKIAMLLVLAYLSSVFQLLVVVVLYLLLIVLSFPHYLQ